MSGALLPFVASNANEAFSIRGTELMIFKQYLYHDTGCAAYVFG